jgi:gliding motility-associated-like protein
MFKQIVFLFLFSVTFLAYSQNNVCTNPTPFCTGQTMQFPAGVNAGSAQTGPNYGCLGSQPNPAWFYFQIATGGPLVITMSANNDIDYIAYGPFNQLSGNCGNLTAANTVGCSYSGSATETLTINNAVPGAFYLLMITNFANTNQQISFSQTNANAAGAAQTNCGVLCSMTVSATNSLCAGGTATMGVTTGTQVTSVTWSGPNGFTSPTGNTSVSNIQATGVYTALATTTGTNPATNTCAATHTIIVQPTPTLVLNNNGPICAGQQASFTATGAGSYTWSGPNGFGSNIASPNIANAQISNNGNYSVIGATNGCTATASTSLQVKPNPTVTASSAGNFCVGQSFGLNATGANSYTWTGPNNFTSTLQNPSFTNNTISYDGTYTLTGNINGCTHSITTNVVIYPLPIITPFTSGNVCAGTSFTLSANGGTAYVWSGPNGFNGNGQQVPVGPAGVSMTGTYNVTGTDANGCVNSATLAQIVHANPIPIASGSSKCIYESLYLTASGGDNYQWSGPQSFNSNQQNPIVANAQLSNAGVYTVTVSTTAGCVATATAYCTVFGRPTIGYTGNTEVCYGGVFSFVANGGITYKWLGVPGELSQANSYTVSSSSPGLLSTYTLVGADGNGCTNQVVIYPQVNALPYAQVKSDSEGACVPFSTRFNISGAAPNINGIQWVFPNSSVINDSLSTSYYVGSPGIHTISVQLVNNKGCKATISNTVQGFPIPKADFSFTPDNPHENDFVVSFTDESNNAVITDWFWDFYSNNQHLSIKQNPVYEFPYTGNYFVFLKVTSNKGCLDSIVKKITVAEEATFFIPNAFTPDGDGNNDIFIPKTVGIKKFKMEIFDRWGELIFVSSDITVGWDGKHKKGGDILPQGVYIYKISAVLNDRTKPKQYTGHVSLLK